MGAAASALGVDAEKRAALAPVAKAAAEAQRELEEARQALKAAEKKRDEGMAKRDEWPAFKDGLPVLGVDGTLAETVPADSPAKGKACAKTGTLVWYDAANDRFLLKSKALAGTLTTKAGTELHFCLMVNNVPLPEGVNATREGKVLGKLCELLYEYGP